MNLQKRTFLVVFVLSISLKINTNLSAQGLEWARAIGGTDYQELANALATDTLGNLYMAGQFAGAIDFDPGPGVMELIAVAKRDIFIEKLSPDGTLIWVKQIGGSMDQSAVDLTLDAQGNIYVGGFYEGSTDFDPGSGVAILPGTPNYSAFVLKMDENGGYLWAKNISGGGSNVTNSLAVDADGSVYATGRFTQSADFDPGAGTTTIDSKGGMDVFVQKLDADGNFVWAKTWGGPVNDEGNNVAIYPDGQVCVAGSFNRTVDFDPNAGVYNLTSTGFNEEDIFIEKLDKDGNMVWARSFGSTERELYPKMALDLQGNVITGGAYYRTADFDPGSGVFNLDPLVDGSMYVQKLDADGNFVWAISMGVGLFSANITALTTDVGGNVYIAGGVLGPIDIDPSLNTYLISAQNNFQDVFFARFTPGASLVWADVLGGEQSDFCNEIYVDAHGQIYMAGQFEGKSDLDPGPGVFNVFSAGSTDLFMTKFGQNWNFHGNVYGDKNNNQIRDSDENGLPGIVVEVDGFDRYVTTDSSGNYRFYSNIANETIRVVPPRPYWQVRPESAVLDSSQTAVNFGIFVDSTLRDIGVSLVQTRPVRSGFNTEYVVYVKNHTFVAVDSITVTLEVTTHDFPLITTNPLALETDGDSLAWFIEKLEPLEIKPFFITYFSPLGLELDETISMGAAVELAQDTYPVNNRSSLRVPVVGSFDPNDKRVFPAWISPEALDSARLAYVIRFQNTGNLPADFVVIRDTLPSGLDINSFEMLGASHPFTWRIYDEAILEVRFDPIFLPDSTSNEPESHGFVSFSIAPNKQLVTGDTIPNRAGIYFDFNPPVITNTSVLKIALVSNALGVHAVQVLEIDIFPNPADGKIPVNIRLNDTDVTDELLIVLYDVHGRVVRQKFCSRYQPVFDIDGLKPGLYFVRVISGQTCGLKPLVIGKN